MTGDPFAASRRSLRVRSILITSVIVIALVTGIYLYTRSQQSSLILQIPQGSTVTLNGNPVAVTNESDGAHIPVIAGQYRLQITRPNYLPFTQDVTIPVGKNVALRPVFTLLPITSQQQQTGGIQFVRPIPSKNLVFYLGDGGTRLYRVDTASQSQIPVSEESITPITGVEWANTADVALVTRPDGTYIFEVPIFNFETQLFEKVAGPEILSPVWDPNNSRIAAALFLPNGERSLILTDKQFSNEERKTDLSGFTNPRLVWSPNSRFIAVVNQSEDPTQNNVWIFNLATSDFTPVTTGGSVVDVSFSPDEQTLLIERTGNKLATRALSTGTEHTVSTPGEVRTSAWNSTTSFYIPEPGTNALLLESTSGSSTVVPYTLPNTSDVLGMFYFGDSDSLVFYTQTAVYTVSLKK